MFLFEIKKILNKRAFFLCVVVFIIINIFNIALNVDKYEGTLDEFNEGWQKVYNSVKGDITKEKMELLQNYYEKMLQEVDLSHSPEKSEVYLSGYAYGDMNIALEHLENIQESISYSSMMSNLISNNVKLENYYHNINNDYMEKYSESVIKNYQGRTIQEYYDYTGFQNLFNYNFSSLLVLLLSVLFSSTIFSEEKQCGMYNLIFSTSNGRLNNSKYKILIVILISFAINVVFLLVDLITFSYFYNMDGVFTKLYCIPDFFYSPINVSILEYILISLFYKFIGTLVISTCSAFFSKIFNNLYSLVLSYATVLFLIFLSCFDKLKGISLNPIYCIQCAELFKSLNIDKIFNTPILHAWTVIGFNFVLIIFFVIFCLKYEKGIVSIDKIRNKKVTI